MTRVASESLFVGLEICAKVTSRASKCARFLASGAGRVCACWFGRPHLGIVNQVPLAGVHSVLLALHRDLAHDRVDLAPSTEVVAASTAARSVSFR